MGTYLCGEGMLGSLGENGNTSKGEGGLVGATMLHSSYIDCMCIRTITTNDECASNELEWCCHSQHWYLKVGSVLRN